MLGHPSKCKTRLWRLPLLALLIVYAAIASAQSDKLRVGFLCSAPPDNPFWSQVIKIMQAAADDLNVELVVKYDPTRSTFATKRLGLHLLNTEPKIDYLVTKYWHSVTDTHLREAQIRGIKVFIINSDIPKDDYRKVGRFPRVSHTNWIGHMVPDDRKAGYDLAATLIERAQLANENQKINILSFRAPAATSVGFSRRSGLKDRLSESGIVLQDDVVANWEADSATVAIESVLRQHPNTNVIWAANEAVAWGAVNAAENLNKSPGKDIFIGGFDWNPKSLYAIADGRLSASMFGHFMEGAWALVLIHDYHHGFDFKDNPGVRIPTPLSILDAKNYSQYKTLIEDENWDSIDFKKMSKKYNPQLEAYNFSISQFLE